MDRWHLPVPSQRKKTAKLPDQSKPERLPAGRSGHSRGAVPAVAGGRFATDPTGSPKPRRVHRRARTENRKNQGILPGTATGLCDRRPAAGRRSDRQLHLRIKAGLLRIFRFGLCHYAPGNRRPRPTGWRLPRRDIQPAWRLLHRR